MAKPDIDIVIGKLEDNLPVALLLITILFSCLAIGSIAVLFLTHNGWWLVPAAIFAPLAVILNEICHATTFVKTAEEIDLDGR